MGNVILGALSLAILEGVLSRSAATARVGGFIASAGKAVEWFLSPSVPAFKSASATTSSTALAVEAAAQGAGAGASLAPAPTPTSAPPTPSTGPFPFQIPGGPVVPAVSA